MLPFWPWPLVILFAAPLWWPAVLPKFFMDPMICFFPNLFIPLTQEPYKFSLHALILWPWFTHSVRLVLFTTSSLKFIGIRLGVSIRGMNERVPEWLMLNLLQLTWTVRSQKYVCKEKSISCEEAPQPRELQKCERKPHVTGLFAVAPVRCSNHKEGKEAAFSLSD